MLLISLFFIFLMLLIGGYFRSEYEKEHLIVKTYEIKSQKIQSTKTFVFLSDLHEHDFGERNQKLIQEIDSINPDAVLIGGDMIVCKKQTITEVSERLCCDLSKRYPIFYANGNHEERMQKRSVQNVKRSSQAVDLHSMQNPDLVQDLNILQSERNPYQDYISKLESFGVTYLSNASICVDDVCIHGLNIDKKYYKKFVKDAMDQDYIQSKLGEGLKSDKFHILLAHSPMYTKAYANAGADVVLSGHFHGGTIRLPFGIGLMTPQFQFFSNQVVGIRKYKNLYHIISAGLGTHSINIRINDKPELIVLQILPE